MDESFWRERWAEGRIGFHRDQPHEALERHFPSVEASATPGRVLVPLCGKARDLLWLRERGLAVVGVEFVRQAIVELGADNALELVARFREGWEVFESGDLELWVADFFSLGVGLIGSFDAAFDRAALVAVPPARRREYAEHLSSLLRPGGIVLLVTLVHDLPGGPPHSVSEAEVRELFSSSFEVRKLSEQDVLRSEPRFVDRGASHFVEQVFRLQRLGSG